MRLPLVTDRIAIDGTCRAEEGDEIGSSSICPFRLAVSLYFDLFSLENDSIPFRGRFPIDFLGAIAKSWWKGDFLS